VTPAARRPRSWTELGGSGRGEGLLLRVAQATTTHTVTSSGFRGSGRRVVRFRVRRPVPGPGSTNGG